VNKSFRARLIPYLREISMCAKCVEIDKSIEQFKELHGRRLEPRTLRSIEILIANLKAKKIAMHSERSE
jgi:hypothetical protein